MCRGVTYEQRYTVNGERSGNDSEKKQKDNMETLKGNHFRTSNTSYLLTKVVKWVIFDIAMG